VKTTIAGTVAGFLVVLALAPPTTADPVPVKFAEGIMRGFPVLRSTTGDKLAQGDLAQVARGDRVVSRLVFRFRDGSYYEEEVVFSQRDVFQLLTYRLVQHGPSFPETLDVMLDRETQHYRVRHRADPDSPEETLEGRFEMPDDVYNGMLTMLLKNLPAGQAHVVNIVAFTPRPRAIKMLLEPAGEDLVFVGDMRLPATRFLLKPQLGLFASLLIVDLPDVKSWVIGGEAPAFLRFEGPLYFMGPVWRIELD
jgi:hypothetical protein